MGTPSLNQRWNALGTRKQTVVVLLILALFAVGAAIVESNHSSETPISSDVPVPPGATRVASSTDSSSSYHLSATTTYAELAAFYDQEMPVGRDWHLWQWCASTSGPLEGGYWRSYVHDTESLVVAINPPSNGYPAGIVIGRSSDDGGSC